MNSTANGIKINGQVFEKILGKFEFFFLKETSKKINLIAKHYYTRPFYGNTTIKSVVCAIPGANVMTYKKGQKLVHMAHKIFSQHEHYLEGGLPTPKNNITFLITNLMQNIFRLNNFSEKSVFSEEIAKNCSGGSPSELMFGPSRI